MMGIYLLAHLPSSKISMPVQMNCLTSRLNDGLSSITNSPRASNSSWSGKSVRNAFSPLLNRHSLSGLRSVYQNSAMRISSRITHSALESPVPRCVKPAPSSASGYILRNTSLLTTCVIRHFSASDPSGNVLFGSKYTVNGLWMGLM